MKRDFSRKASNHKIGDTMEPDISNLPTQELLEKIEESNDRKVCYEAAELLFKRWRKGSDLEFLIDLLRSEKSKYRIRGAYYLGELGGDLEELRRPVIELAKDPLSYCRCAFASYMATSKFYDDAIANGLAECLLDHDLTVRSAAIDWGVRASDERFESFSQMVESGAGARKPRFPDPLSNDFWNEVSRKRARRGLEIIRRLRSGEGAEQIRKAVPEEDSVVLDNLLFSQTRGERLAEWQRMRSQNGSK